MLNILESNDLQGYFNGETLSPPKFIIVDGFEQPSPAFGTWQGMDQLVKAQLTATLSKDLLAIVVGLNTMVEIWHVRASLDRRLELEERLTSIKQVTDTLSTYLQGFKSIYDELPTIKKPMSSQVLLASYQTQ